MQHFLYRLNIILLVSFQIISCKTSQKEPLSNIEVDSSCKDWKRVAIASDRGKRSYQVYFCKDFVAFVASDNKLTYSRKGDVIGFMQKDQFHFHSPKRGWRNMDISNVGPITNRYEGSFHLPRFNKYKKPTTLVK